MIGPFTTFNFLHLKISNLCMHLYQFSYLMCISSQTTISLWFRALPSSSVSVSVKQSSFPLTVQLWLISCESFAGTSRTAEACLLMAILLLYGALSLEFYQLQIFSSSLLCELFTLLLSQISVGIKLKCDWLHSSFSSSGLIETLRRFRINKCIRCRSWSLLFETFEFRNSFNFVYEKLNIITIKI